MFLIPGQNKLSRSHGLCASNSNIVGTENHKILEKNMLARISN